MIWAAASQIRTLVGGAAGSCIPGWVLPEPPSVMAWLSATRSSLPGLELFQLSPMAIKGCLLVSGPFMTTDAALGAKEGVKYVRPITGLLWLIDEAYRDAAAHSNYRRSEQIDHALTSILLPTSRSQIRKPVPWPAD